MTNKKFKQLIKKHQVKQSFVRILGNTILRFYKDTISEDLWCSKWKAECGSVNVTVEPLDRCTWAFHWHKYTAECHTLREGIKQVPDVVKNLAKSVGFEQYPIKCNEFHRILYSAIDFMLKDKRVE